MTPLLRSVLSTVARLLAAFAVLAGALVAGAFALMAPGRPSLVAAAVATAILFLGFLGLRIANRQTAPLRAYRLSLGVGLLVAGFLLSALPWPPHGFDLGTAAVLGAGILISLVCITLAGRVPRLGVALAAVLALYGAIMAIRFMRQLGAVYIASWGPAIVLSYLLALCMGIAWLTGFVQLLWTHRRARAAIYAQAA